MESTDVPMEGESGSGWQGMTIKDIFEKVDLLDVSVLGENDCVGKVEGDLEPVRTNCTSAFLGPRIWKKPITLPMLGGSGERDAEFTVINIEEFLNENNFDLAVPPLPDSHILGDIMKTSDTEEDSLESSCSSPGVEDLKGRKKPKNELPKGENDFLYRESKKARLEREREEERKKMEFQIEFCAEELALASIPGADFDPKRRCFTVEELRPQPIIRKGKKHYVPTEKKDDKYWEKRQKNNFAARRSREARRLKENQVALRTAYLEKENAALKEAMDKVVKEKKKLELENRVLLKKMEKFEQSLL